MHWKLGFVFCLAASVAFADRPLSTPPIGLSPVSAALSAVAPLGNAFLAVWSDTPAPGSYHLRAIRVDADGKPIDAASFEVVKQTGSPSFLVAGGGDEVVVGWVSQSNPEVLWSLLRIDANGVVTPLTAPPRAMTGLAVSGGNVLAVTQTDSRIAVTLLDRDGAVIRADVPVALAAGHMISSDVTPAGDGFLIVYTDDVDGRVRVVHLATSAIRDGSVVATVDRADSFLRASTPRIAVNGDRALALWNEGDEVRARPLTAAGIPTSSTPVDVGAFQIPGSFIAFGDGFLATFFERYDGAQYNLVVAHLDASGGIVSTLRTNFHGGPYLRAMAAASGSSAMIVWTGVPSVGGSVFEVLAAPEALIGAPTVVSLAPAGSQRTHALFATATGTIAVWSEAAPERSVVIGRLDAAGVPLDGAGFRLRVAPTSQTRAEAAFNGKEMLVAWVERAPDVYSFSIYGAIVSPDSPSAARVVRLADSVIDDPIAVAWNGNEWVVVWRRTKTFDLAAIRVSRAGDPIDTVPVTLTPPRPSVYAADVQPRIAWNGSEYLLVWQRQRFYFPVIGIGEVPGQPVGDLVAQRVTRELVPDGQPVDIALAPGDLENNPISADGADLAVANGMWLVAWYENNPGESGAAFARIDPAGVRLDPLNGRRIAGFGDFPMHVAASGSGWVVAGDRLFVTVTRNGDTTAAVTVAPSLIDAFTIDTSLPIVAYIVAADGDTRAWVHLVTQRRRAAR